MDRWIALDAVKGVGVISMTLTHSLCWYFVYPFLRLPSMGSSWFDILFLTGGVFIMGLVFAAGSSLRLSWQQYIDVDSGRIVDHTNQLAKKVATRSLQLFIMATVINIMVWDWEAAWYWNVLHFIALAQIVIYGAARLGGTRLLALLALCSGVSSFWYRELQILGSQGVVGEILIGDLTSLHIWPLLPWLCIPVIGYLIAHYRDTFTARGSRTLMATIGATLLGVALTAGLYAIPIGYSFGKIWDYAVQPPLAFLLAAIGVYILLLNFMDRIPHYGGLLAWIPLLGRNVTYLYAVHLLVGFWYYIYVLNSESVSVHFFWLGLGVQFLTYGVVLVITPRIRKVINRKGSA